MIRYPTLDDVNACVALAVDQYGEFLEGCGISVNIDDLRGTTEFIIKNGTALVIECDGEIVGMCAWLIAPHPANSACKCWQEVLWCVKSPVKSDALKLFRAMIKHGKDCQIQILARLNTDNGEQVEKLYKRNGFKFMESHFFKSIGE